jgi:hypothetical protein
MLKSGGTCDGIQRRQSWVSCGELRCVSRERQSLTPFFSPGNHCKYSRTRASKSRKARCRAASKCNGWLWSEKFDFRSHPAAEVLSPCASRQDPCPTRPSRISNQIQMMPPRNSSRLREIPARQPTRQLSGSSIDQARPLRLQRNPPSRARRHRTGRHGSGPGRRRC